MLRKNDLVEVISPGCACTQSELEQIKNYLKKIGLRANIFLEKETSLKKPASHEFASVAAQTRFEQFKKAVENPDSKIIWCSRGGYGSAEILPFLMKMKKPKQQKIFIGFSDISSLNKILIEDWNWQVITAPMLVQLALKAVSKKSEKAILDLVFGRVKELKYKLELTTGPRNKCGVTKSETLQNIATPHLLRGPVVGGCVSVIASNFATKNQLDWNKKILFLEDEGEDGERLDRYFHQIATISLEQKKLPAAIILGNFLQANPHGTPKAKNIEMALKKFAEKLPQIPIFQEKTNCLGHSKDMLPLVLGAESEIIANSFLVQKI